MVQLRSKGYPPRAGTPAVCRSASGDSTDLDTFAQALVIAQFRLPDIVWRRRKIGTTADVFIGDVDYSVYLNAEVINLIWLFPFYVHIYIYCVQQ
jgi:hypothetical protein